MGDIFADINYGTMLFWALVSVAFIIVTIVAVILIKRHNAGQLPHLRIQEASYSDSQLEEIDKTLADTGFAYDYENNIYYSVMNPWQRKFGYCKLYDDWSTPLGMVFDCEPVQFDYNGKKWLMEFWKGQYGITIGGEIGIYNTAEADLDIPGVFKGTYYHSAEEDEKMDMSFTIRKKDDVLFSRTERHWWLTGFLLGEYSNPSSVVMDASVTLPNPEMRDLFTKAIRELGYTDEEIKYNGDTVQFTFAKPRSRQPIMRRSPASYISLLRNWSLVAEYKQVTKGLTNMHDILMALQTQAPHLYDLAIGIGKQRELFERFEEIGKYLT